MRNRRFLAFVVLSFLSLSSASASLEYPARVVAVGDVHSDLRAWVDALLATKLIEEMSEQEFLKELQKSKSAKTGMPDWRIREEKRVERYRWIGGETVLVQTGDMVDRGADTIAVYALLRRLQKQAKEAGGAVIPLLGNHETMNACNNMVYASNEELATFGPSLPRAKQIENRKKVFSATGFLGKEIRERDSVAIVGGTVYSHAGISGDWLSRPIPINQMIRSAMSNCDWNPNDAKIPQNMQSTLELIYHAHGPQWTRYYDMGNILRTEQSKRCEDLVDALLVLKAERMVIGHNPQEDGMIHSFCEHKLFLIDVGMSSGIYNHTAAALEMQYTYEGKGDARVASAVQITAVYATGKREVFNPATANGGMHGYGSIMNPVFKLFTTIWRSCFTP